MTRFKKEMIKRFSAMTWEDDTGDIGAYVIEEKALIVFYHPCIVTVLQFLRNGKQKEVTNDFPEISAPYLLHLCNGDREKAIAILKSNHL